MRKVILRFGLYATIALVLLSALHFFFIPAELAGYLSMILSMIFVFAGIRYYRDHHNEGVLSFGEGMKIGILIVLIPSLAFGLFDIIYTEVIEPGWLEEYYSKAATKVKASGKTAAEIDLALQKLEKQKQLFSNPLMQFLLMAATVLVIGIIATIISTVALMRKKKPAIA